VTSDWIVLTEGGAMSLFDLLWIASQEGRIREAASNADSARSSIERTRDESVETRRLIEGLRLTCQALWEIVRSQHGLTDDVILKKIEEIDLRDGKLDGKMTASVPCPECNHEVRANRRNCLYCGTPIASPHIFQRETPVVPGDT
jgi:hypothetical protein